MTEPMTPERLEEIRRRVEKTTPGDWSAGWAGDPDDEGGKDEAAPFGIVSAGHGLICDFLLTAGGHQRTWEQAEANADFVEHAHRDIPDLLDEIARLRAEVERLSSPVRSHPMEGLE